MIIQTIKAKYQDSRPPIEWRFHSGSALLSRIWLFSGLTADYVLLRKVLTALSLSKIPGEFDEIQYDIRDDGGRSYSFDLTASRSRVSINNGPRLEQAQFDRVLRDIWGNGVGLIPLGPYAFNVRHFVRCAGNPPYAISFEENGTHERIAAEWLEKQLKLAIQSTQNLLQIDPSKIQHHQAALEINSLDAFFKELQAHHILLEELQKNYKEYQPSSFTLESLQDKREKLRQDVLDLDKIESILSSIVYHSRLLLSQDEEGMLRARIAENLRSCELTAPPTVEDMQSWGDLIRILGEIKFAEKTIQLTSRLSSSYESKIKSISEIYSKGKKELETSLQNLGERILDLKKTIDSNGLVKLKGWQTVPEFIKKTLQPTFSEDVLTSIDALDGKFRTLFACLPDDREFDGPLFRLGDFQEEQKKQLISLKEKWKMTTKIPLKEGFSDFFLYGLQHFELIWYNHLLTENQRIRQQADKKIEILRDLVAKHPEQREFDLKVVDHVINYAQVLINVKPLKVKKLCNLEDRLIKLQVRSEIRAELTRKKEEIAVRWAQSFEARGFKSVALESPQSNALLAQAQRIAGLRHLRENCIEKFEVFASSIEPNPLSTWCLDDSPLTENERHYILSRLDHLPSSQLLVILTRDPQILTFLRGRSAGWIENDRALLSDKSQLSSENSVVQSKKARAEKIVGLLNGLKI